MKPKTVVIFALLSIAAPAARAGFISVGDYPEEAARLGEHGSVIVNLDIGVDGNVTQCRPARSSGYPTLDRSSCDLLSSRGRFHPARNAAGNAIANTIRMTVHWILPSAAQTFADLPVGANDILVTYQGSSRKSAVLKPLTNPIAGLKYPAKARRFEREGDTTVALDVNARGLPKQCHVVRTSNFQELDEAFCDHLIKSMRYEPNSELGEQLGVDIVTTHWRIRE